MLNIKETSSCGRNAPTYEEVSQQLEKDYVVKLPDRAALNF